LSFSWNPDLASLRTKSQGLNDQGSSGFGITCRQSLGATPEPPSQITAACLSQNHRPLHETRRPRRRKAKDEKGKDGDEQAKKTGRQRVNGAKTESKEPPPPSATNVEDELADLPDLADLISQVQSQLKKEG
jgi:hypothetical protein